ncbi:ArsR/SmtB family transcription factor [Solibacillus merdavium]|uniref:Winged helix-turn-helix transcriptional regulator n=1 Tax=Solibacillus merdavium TaxID=2762218 RepID=A0ABR8XPT3_9BACL|nr:metalloregulator ArsR/SmtB family transcription factor [Solibacillus merdavium]MBD8033950.1 winged helix-turn-helix transcriptional regulator [Solibacillus merdavium]
MDLLEQQLKALADKNRLTLLACMKNGEVCVCDFVEVLGISQPAVSQQLKKLKDAGIILERKKGTWKYYRIAEQLSPVVEAVINQLEADDGCRCGGNTCSC